MPEHHWNSEIEVVSSDKEAEKNISALGPKSRTKFTSLGVIRYLENLDK